MRTGRGAGLRRLDPHRAIDSHALKKSRGSGGWPPDQEKLPFLSASIFKKVWDQRKSPRVAAWGWKDPCVINHFVQELINGNRSEEEPNTKRGLLECENRYRSAAANRISRL